MRGGKSGSRSQAVQRGRLRAAALSVWFSVLSLLPFSWRGLGCGARARSAKVCGAATAAPQCLKAALVYAKHTPWCQTHKFSRSRYKLNIYCSTLFFFKQRNRLFNVRLRASFRNMYVKIFDCSATSNIIDSYKFI